MSQTGSLFPRLPEPLPAVLVGAGFFVLAAVFAGAPPFAGAGKDASVASPAQAAGLRVLGSGQAGVAGVDALAGDLAWLRAQGAGTIVIEAWLDQAPQSDLGALEGALQARFDALPQGAARKRGLQVLSATAAEFDDTARLTGALKDAQVLLAFQALPGQGPPLPAALKREAYQVSLRGETKTLPDFQAGRVPFDAALAAAGGAGAVPMDGASAGRPAAVVCINGEWVDSLGLEAARLSLGLPLQGLRYRWSQGLLNSLELSGVRYALDGEGRAALPSAGFPPALSMDSLRQDPVAAAKLKGKTVFFRPWPAQAVDAQAFDAQARLFGFFMDRVQAAAPGPVDAKRACLAGALLLLPLFAYAPLWAAVVLWGLASAAAFWFFGAPTETLVQTCACAAAALSAGLGWRLQRFEALAQAAGRRLRGLVAPGRLLAWHRRLGKGAAALESAYAVVGPRPLLEGPAFEAWMERWGAMLDEGVAGDRLGLVWGGPQAEADLAGALLDLRRQSKDLAGGLSLGTLSLRAEARLGASRWHTEGPAKERAEALAQQALAGQWLLSKQDYAVFGAFVEARSLARPGAAAALGPDEVMNVLGPRTGLWEGRP